MGSGVIGHKSTASGNGGSAKVSRTEGKKTRNLQFSQITASTERERVPHLAGLDQTSRCD